MSCRAPSIVNAADPGRERYFGETGKRVSEAFVGELIADPSARVFASHEAAPSQACQVVGDVRFRQVQFRHEVGGVGRAVQQRHQYLSASRIGQRMTDPAERIEIERRCGHRPIVQRELNYSYRLLGSLPSWTGDEIGSRIAAAPNMARSRRSAMICRTGGVGVAVAVTTVAGRPR
mgnify:CR=1 FL=1